MTLFGTKCSFIMWYICTINSITSVVPQSKTRTSVNTSKTLLYVANELSLCGTI